MMSTNALPKLGYTDNDRRDLYLAGYYGYRSGKIKLPTFRESNDQGFLPVDFMSLDPELSRAVRLQDWHTLGMLAAMYERDRAEALQRQASYKAQCEGATVSAWHMLHREMAADQHEPSPIRQGLTPAERRHLESVEAWGFKKP